ncbi:hypothetical protein [Paludibacterium purpuratum]|uniref:Peptidoglycan-synthase activator LpoB n=1 Tax=Paludibacterium purpuratum TaxID=1144873 RepID=A0A4R7BCL9_9NEIS|nr:hypothetical protein [Paludibacterium purpuratum]TDR82701.1 peptidoglycan-synthase activator LpoB [Paludibacterium purpuratum]
MKRFLQLAMFWVFGLGAFANPTVTVLPVLESNSNLPIAAISDAYAQTLVNSRRFTTVAPGQQTAMLNALKQQPAGLLGANPKTLANLGKQAGAQMVAVARVNGSESPLHPDEIVPDSNNKKAAYITILTLEMRLIDVQTGMVTKTLFANVRNYSDDKDKCLDDSLSDLQDKLKSEIQTVYPLEGNIVKNSADKKYIINLGAADGLEDDSTMLIYEDGQPIPDPSTGKLLLGEQTMLGDGVITQLSADSAVLRVKHLKGTIVEGQTKVKPKP